MPPRDLIPFDPTDPLRRIPRAVWYPGETAAANMALRDYTAMGVKRSLDALLAEYSVQLARFTDKTQAAKPPTTNKSTLTGWSFRYSWVLRVTCYDELENERRTNEDRELWLGRRAELRKADWDQGDKLRKLTDEMLAVASKYVVKSRSFSPGTPTVVDKKGNVISKGKPDTQTLNIALNEAILPRIAKLASDMQRLAAGEPTEHTQTTSIGMTLSEWQKAQAERRDKAAESAAIFDVD